MPYSFARIFSCNLLASHFWLLIDNDWIVAHKLSNDIVAFISLSSIIVFAPAKITRKGENANAFPPFPVFSGFGLLLLQHRQSVRPERPLVVVVAEGGVHAVDG